MGLIPHKSFLGLFLVISILFICSWFFVLRSTGRPGFVDRYLLPNSKFVAASDNRLVVENTGHSVSFGSYRKKVLKVFMYDLPPEFHFGLTGWKPKGNNVWPDVREEAPHYPGGLNLQHSIEYWLTMDLLSSETSDNLSGRSAIRVRNSSEADVIFVPFFSSISYNRFKKIEEGKNQSINDLLQEKLVTLLTSQEEWKRSGGSDHIVLAHHPNSLSGARATLYPAMYILSDFGRYPPTIANVEKDLIAPYMHVVLTYANDSSTFNSRPTLLYFQGAIYRKDGGEIRQELYRMIKDEQDVHFQFGTIQKDGIRQSTKGMRSSKFCLCIAGDTPSSNRLFDSIVSHCVPVIISDNLELPYEDVLDYSEFCIFIRESDALKKNFLLNFMRNIKKEEWTKMWNRLLEVDKFFEFQYPSQEGDAVQMIWQAISRKVPPLRLKVNRDRRYAKSKPIKETSQLLPLPSNFW